MTNIESKMPEDSTSVDIKEETYNFEVRSEAVQNILGTPPKWIIRWGSVLVVVITSLLFLSTFLIRYPDVIDARIELLSEHVSEDIKGRVYLPIKGAGKVKPGQRVNIKLDAYPYMEFGLLKGQVMKLPDSSVTKNNEIYLLLYVELPNQLKTVYGQELLYSNHLIGRAEIITADIRLVDRLLNPIRVLFVK